MTHEEQLRKDIAEIIYSDLKNPLKILELEARFQAQRKEIIEEIEECFEYHDEGKGDYCDTGGDMDWACRSKCVGMGMERLAHLKNKLR